LTAAGIKPKMIFDQTPLADRMRCSAFIVHDSKISRSDFNGALKGSSKSLNYTTLNGCIGQIARAVRTSNRRKYVYSYWGELDKLNHRHGYTSLQVNRHFLELDRAIAKLHTALHGSSSLLLITSDHGHMIADRSHTILLNDHPELERCLTLPLCGEPRAAYCYLHPARVRPFLQYIRKTLSHAMTAIPSHALLRRGAFGNGKAHPQLEDRIGDYTLILKKGYIIKDFLLGEERELKIGHHGGISREEMLVPLVAFRG